MKDFGLKLICLVMSLMMLSIVYKGIEPSGFLENIGTFALLLLPLKFMTRESYKFWKEI